MKFHRFAFIGTIVGALAIAFSFNAFADDFDSPAEHEMTKEEWIMLHALDDALQNARFYDCRVELHDDQELTIARGREQLQVDFGERRTEVSTSDNAITVNSYSQGDDDGAWYSKVVKVVLSNDQMRVIGLRFRASRFDHVNEGTVLKPDYKTVLTPVEQFYCNAN